MKLFCLSALLCGLVACSGSGDDGVDHIPDAGTPPDVLTKTAPEAAGSNCQYGGTEVQVGVDQNGNGILDAGEVQSTFYICDQAPTTDPLASVYYGELVIGSPADVAAAQSYTGVIGDLIISPDSDVSSFDVELPNLMFVAGTLTDCSFFGNQGGAKFPATTKPVPPSTTVSLAALQVVGGVELECADSPETISLPALTGIHGALLLDNANIVAWSAPVLASVETSIDVTNTGLTALKLPAIGNSPQSSLTITDNAQLDDCAMDDLAGAVRRGGFRGQITINENGAGLGSGSGSGSDEDTTCTDVAHVCQAVTIGGDAADWRECYQSMDFGSARAMCQAIGTGWDLAYFTSIADEETLGALAYSPTYWIGYYQAEASAPYTWVQAPANQTFAPQSFMDPTDGAFWNNGEPNGDANPDCVQSFTYDGLDPNSVVANDTACDNAYMPLCRYLP
ncbi:MAG TPA: C-type lectin domain-containing protein [Kofleriaceae bacterium]|nr:C-type lectin domain-containing protein [Kofleriaceae bacterium]